MIRMGVYFPVTQEAEDMFADNATKMEYHNMQFLGQYSWSSRLTEMLLRIFLANPTSWLLDQSGYMTLTDVPLSLRLDAMAALHRVPDGVDASDCGYFAKRMMENIPAAQSPVFYPLVQANPVLWRCFEDMSNNVCPINVDELVAVMRKVAAKPGIDNVLKHDLLTWAVRAAISLPRTEQVLDGVLNKLCPRKRTRNN